MHAGAEVQLWFMDEARIGQKGRAGHRWYEKGERPPGLVDQRFASAWLYAAVRPKSGEDVALVLPSVSAAAERRGCRAGAAERLGGGDGRLPAPLR